MRYPFLIPTGVSIRTDICPHLSGKTQAPRFEVNHCPWLFLLLHSLFRKILLLKGLLSRGNIGILPVTVQSRTRLLKEEQ